MCEVLKRLKPLSGAAWPFEQFSTRRQPERQMAKFRDVLTFCDVFDIGFTGVPWTFDNKQKGDRNMKVRLDMAVASASWSSFF
jgi:hypothetical protein